jgi:hypothetical protein
VVPADRQDVALAAAGVALAVALAVVLGRQAVTRGRQRRWRPSALALTLTWPEPAEPGPPLELFQDLDAKP